MPLSLGDQYAVTLDKKGVTNPILYLTQLTQQASKTVWEIVSNTETINLYEKPHFPN